MSKSQETISKEHRRLRRKFRNFWDKRERRTDMYKRIYDKFKNELEWLVDQAEQMEAWAAKENKRPSLLRFNNWLKRAIEWGKGPESNKPYNEDDDEELQRTKRRIEELR